MVSQRRTIGYGMGDMGLSISYFTVGFFFIYYLTDIVGLAPYLAGLAYFIGNAWDSVNDPLVGALSDRTVSRHGRKRAYVLFGALPFAVSFFLLWMIPLDGSQTVKFVFATVAMLLYATMYSLVEVPYMALVPVMTGDYNERTRIVGIRAMLSTLGTLLGGGAAMLVSSFESELTGLRLMALVFSIWALATVLLAAKSARGVEVEATDPAPQGSGLLGYLGPLRDRNILILLFFKFLGAIATGSLIAALPYFAKHVLGDEGRSTVGLALYIAVSAACIPLWERLARRYDKRRLLLGAMGGAAVILVAIGLLVTGAAITAFYAGCALLGTVMSAYVVLAYSFPTDLVDYYQLRSGQRLDSTIFGMWVTAHQLGIACAGLLLGFLLQSAGYDGSREVQGSGAILAVRLALGLIPGIFMLMAVGVLQRYAITRGAYADIRAALERRQVAGAAGISDA